MKLVGCCIQGGEPMLIYEYLPNKSLDSFLFGKPFHIDYILTLVQMKNLKLLLQMKQENCSWIGAHGLSL